jgi:hypothetical protein
MTNNQHEATPTDNGCVVRAQRISEFTDRFAAAYDKRFPDEWGFPLGPTYYNALQEYLDALSQAEQRIDLVVARMDDHYSRELKAWEAHKGLRKALAKEIGE